MKQNYLVNGHEKIIEIINQHKGNFDEILKEFPTQGTRIKNLLVNNKVELASEDYKYNFLYGYEVRELADWILKNDNFDINLIKKKLMDEIKVIVEILNLINDRSLISYKNLEPITTKIMDTKELLVINSNEVSQLAIEICKSFLTDWTAQNKFERDLKPGLTSFLWSVICLFDPKAIIIFKDKKELDIIFQLFVKAFLGFNEVLERAFLMSFSRLCLTLSGYYLQGSVEHRFLSVASELILYLAPGNDTNDLNILEAETAHTLKQFSVNISLVAKHSIEPQYKDVTFYCMNILKIVDSQLKLEVFSHKNIVKQFFESKNFQEDIEILEKNYLSLRGWLENEGSLLTAITQKIYTLEAKSKEHYWSF